MRDLQNGSCSEIFFDHSKIRSAANQKLAFCEGSDSLDLRALHPVLNGFPKKAAISQ